MKRFLLKCLMCIACGLVSACADRPAPTPVYSSTYTSSYSPPSKTAADIKADAERWVDCLFARIRELDDRRSDAGTIAIAVRSACHSIYNGSESAELGLATQAVLKARQTSQQRTKARTDAAADAWVACAIPKIKEMDDGVTDPSDLAARVIPHCRHLSLILPAEEQRILTNGIVSMRNRSNGSTTVSPPTRMPSTDLKF